MLLHYNKGLVQHFVWRCKRMGTSCGVGELVLAGEEALYKAAIKWDPTKGTRFSTFAFQRVNRAIVGYLMEHEDVIKLPVNLKELQGKIKGAQARLSQVNKNTSQVVKGKSNTVQAVTSKQNTLEAVIGKSTDDARLSQTNTLQAVTDKTHFRLLQANRQTSGCHR